MKNFEYKNLTFELLDKVIKEFEEEHKDKPRYVVWDLNPPIFETMVDALLRKEFEELEYRYILWEPLIKTKTIDNESIFIMDYPDRL